MMHDYIHECAKLTSFKIHRDVPEQATSQIMNLGTLLHSLSLYICMHLISIQYQER